MSSYPEEKNLALHKIRALTLQQLFFSQLSKCYNTLIKILNTEIFT